MATTSGHNDHIIDISKINDDFFQFIEDNCNDNVDKLRLRRYPDATFDTGFAITQIECRKRVRKKLPELFNNYKFIFPSVLSTEQCTSEIVAKYHASVIGNLGSLLDMTGGLGIDDYYIASTVDRVVAIERNELTALVGKYNMSALRPNVEIVAGDSVDYLSKNERNFDAVFVDPARRGSNHNRLYGLADCEPNIIPLLHLIRSRTNMLYVKASPMLDVTQVLRELSGITDMWIISLHNECKELFLKIDFKLADSMPSVPDGSVANNSGTMIHCVNFVDDDVVQQLDMPYLSHVRMASVSIAANVLGYLYEPNASIMKANAFAELCGLYGVQKIAVNSHLFTSAELVNDFPGRVFAVEGVYPFKDKVIKSALGGERQINVSVRNFKLTAEQLKKRLKLLDGGSRYMFGTTNSRGEMIVVVCRRL